MIKIFRTTIILASSMILSSCIFQTLAFTGGATALAGTAWFSYERRPTVSLINDAMRQSEFASILKNNETLTNSNLHVTSFNNQLVITGSVKTLDEKKMLHNLLNDYANTGIKKFYDESIIGPDPESWASYQDSITTTKIKAQILYQYKDPSHIKVTTSNGTVFLMGIVTKDEAEQAVNIACNTIGVNKVIKIFDIKS